MTYPYSHVTKTTWATFVVLLSLTLAACSSETGKALSDPASDTSSIIGTWQIVELWDSGRKAPDDAISSFQLTFEEDTLKYDLGGITVNAVYDLDPTKDPKWIDIEPDGRDVSHGIYELANDTLRLVLPEGNAVQEGKRSKSFESDAESANDWYAILKRL